MQKNLLLVALVFMGASTALAQKKQRVNVDSLLAAAAAYPKDDTVKVKMLLALSDAFIMINPKDGIPYSESALVIVENYDAPELKADALYIKAQLLELTSKYNDALDLATKAFEIYEKLRRTKKIVALNNLLGRIYYDKTSFENAKRYYELALSASESTGDIKNKTIALTGFGNIYLETGDFTKAITYYQQSLALAERSHDSVLESNVLTGISNHYFKQGNYIKSLEYAQKSLRINENINYISRITLNYILLSNVYLKLLEPEKALTYLNKALSLAIKKGDRQQEATTYVLMGGCYLEMKMYTEAAASIEKSIAINKAIGNTAKANSNLLTLGAVYAESKRMVDAHRCFQEVLEISRKLNNQFVIVGALINLGTIYTNQPDSLLVKMGINPRERYAKAIATATEALEISTKINSLARVSLSLELLSTIYEKQQNYVQAYDIYKKYIVLKDSISGDDVKKQITRKEIQYEYDKKETALKYEQQLTASALEKQRLLTLQQGQSLTLKEQALALSNKDLLLSNKEKDLSHLAYLKEQAEKQEKTQELSLSQEREKGKTRDLDLKNIELSAQQKQNLYLGLFAAFLLLGLVALLYFYNTLRKQKAIIAQQNEINEQTIAILSHDIKEPLLGVKLLLKKLNKDDPFVAQASQSLEHQINSVNGILTNLLKMKKASFAKKDNNASANVNTVVKNVLQELNMAIENKTLHIKNELADDLTLPIAPEKLQIIVHNLLSNAVKYSFPDQTIRIFREGKGFSIQDAGVGLSPEQRSKIMREVTASERGTQQERGNGLGLFLVGAMLQGEQLKVVFESPEVGGTIAKIVG
jgi:tetratricopeptide (TPR) repeat protein/two-component sensor histidine kinase